MKDKAGLLLRSSDGGANWEQAGLPFRVSRVLNSADEGDGPLFLNSEMNALWAFRPATNEIAAEDLLQCRFKFQGWSVPNAKKVVFFGFDSQRGTNCTYASGPGRAPAVVVFDRETGVSRHRGLASQVSPGRQWGDVSFQNAMAFRGLNGVIVAYELGLTAGGATSISRVLKSSNGGDDWSLALQSPYVLRSAQVLDDGTALVVGYRQGDFVGVILHLEASGKVTESFLGKDLAGIAMGGQGSGWAYTIYGGKAWRTMDGGRTWAAYTALPGGSGVRQFVVSRDGHVLLVAAGYLYKWDISTDSWQEILR